MKEKIAYRKDMTFVEALRQGLADYDDIDDYIDAWHNSSFQGEVYEFLGMTKQQYFKWGEDENYLKQVFPKGSKKEK